MAVDVFEAVDVPVRGRHQLDHPLGTVAGDPRGLVEALPAAEVVLDIAASSEEPLDADGVHQLHHVIDADEGHEVQVGLAAEGHVKSSGSGGP
jgi:hypothetical protein